MKYRILLSLFCILYGSFNVFGATVFHGKRFHSQTVKNVSLKNIAKYGHSGTDKLLKISNVLLEDVRGFEDHWAYLFQLYDKRTKFRRGVITKSEHPCCKQEFSIFSDEAIGKPLLEQKDLWLNKSVNVYIQITDRGLTPFMNIGYISKVELLDRNRKIIKTLPEE